MDLFEREASFEKSIATPYAWYHYLMVGVKFLAIFYLVTLCLEVYLYSIHRGQTWDFLDIMIFFFYGSTVLLALIKMIKKLPIAAILLASPIIPLFMLILVVSSFPLLKVIDKFLM